MSNFVQFINFVYGLCKLAIYLFCAWLIWNGFKLLLHIVVKMIDAPY